MAFFEVEGDLLDFECQYIAHQCNCVSVGSAGIAAAIFKKYPESNTYLKHDEQRSVPGTIDVIGRVINMYSQYYPGHARYNNDTDGKRRKWFKKCLFEISKIDGIESVAFPYKIGCNLAGGNWNENRKMLENFSKINPEIDVFVVRKEQ